MEDNAHNANEPDPAYVVQLGNTWSKVGVTSLPNLITNDDSHEGPFDSTYQTAVGFYHWRTRMNWEPAKGLPLLGQSTEQRV